MQMPALHHNFIYAWCFSKFVLEGTVGSGSRADIAVDDLTVLEGACDTITAQSTYRRHWSVIQPWNPCYIKEWLTPEGIGSNFKNLASFFKLLSYFWCGKGKINHSFFFLNEPLSSVLAKMQWNHCDWALLNLVSGFGISRRASSSD